MGVRELHLELHFARDLLTTPTIHGLQEWLSTNAPQMAAALEVHAHERDRDRVQVAQDDPHGLMVAIADRGLSRGSLYRRLVNEYPPVAGGQRRFGDAIVQGRGKGTTGRFLTVHFDSTTPVHRRGDHWLWSNSISANVSTRTVEGLPQADWVRQLGEALASDPDFLWGAAYDPSEFYASNMDTTNGGLRALGRDARKHLPGLYWINFFGRAYTSLMDVDRARSTGIGVWGRVGETVTFECGAAPAEWESYLSEKHQIIEALGADLFFDRRVPTRKTRAPDFGAATSSGAAKPLEVFTSDGVNFTELPPG